MPDSSTSDCVTQTRTGPFCPLSLGSPLSSFGRKGMPCQCCCMEPCTQDLTHIRASGGSVLCWPRMRALPEESRASTKLAPTHRSGLEFSPLTPSTHLGALETPGYTSLADPLIFSTLPPPHHHLGQCVQSSNVRSLLCSIYTHFLGDHIYSMTLPILMISISDLDFSEFQTCISNCLPNISFWLSYSHLKCNMSKIKHLTPLYKPAPASLSHL